jgi:tRNA1(Val) A37 N6-methylase TrmN6
MSKLDEETINNYGIIYSPDNLVNKILDLIPREYYKNPELKWLDIGAGNGAFSLNLYSRLYNDLSSIIIDDNKRKIHIIENMIYMVEIYPDHIKKLEELFTKQANIITKDYLSFTSDERYYDFIIGNPPYNINGALKTPTNSKLKKCDDGKTIYVEFVYKSLELLKPNKGFLNLIIPSLWLKPDKAGLYETLTNLKIHKLCCLSTNETQKVFNYKAQTPTCYFLIENRENNKTLKTIPLYDSIHNNYMNYILEPQYPIPTKGISIINKLMPYVKKVGSLKIYKSSMPGKKTILSTIYSESTKFANIKSCTLENNKPKLTINYSNIQQNFYNKPKIIMAHKMYGFPYLDISGIYGISARDNYIILKSDYSLAELKEFYHFLSSKFAIFIFTCTNYRMRYLEKYAFEFLPIITRITNFPRLSNLNITEKEDAIADFFNLSTLERETIKKIKNYTTF